MSIVSHPGGVRPWSRRRLVSVAGDHSSAWLSLRGASRCRSKVTSRPG